MAKAEDYAQWIVNNSDKKGTPEFDTVVQAYRLSKNSHPAPEAPSQLLPTTSNFENSTFNPTPQQQQRTTPIAKFEQGISDPLTGVAQIAQQALPQGMRDKVIQQGNQGLAETGNPARIPSGGLNQQVQENEQAYQGARQAMGDTGFDTARTAGNVTAALPLAFIPGGPEAGLMRQGLTAAGQGAIIGAAQPVTEGNFSNEKAKQIGTGTLLSMAGVPVANAAGRILSPQVNPQIEALMREGITPTPGQIVGGMARTIEDKAMSLPVIGDIIGMGRKRAEAELNRAAYARALEGTGVNAKDLPLGPEGILAVKQAVSKQYDDLLPKLSFMPDQQFNSELNNLKNMAQGLGANEQVRFNNILNDALSKTSPNGGMAGETYKIVESKLGKEADRFSSSTDAYQRELGDALTEAQRIFKDTLTRSNPEYSQALNQANSNFANYVRLRNAGQSAGDKAEGFTPAQLAAAVRNSDKSVGKGNVSTGQALMQDLSRAGQTLTSKYPDSGTAGRALMAGGMGAAGYANPAILAGAGAASLPYTPIGQKIAAALLTKRPELAKPSLNAIADALKRVMPASFAASSE